MEDEFKADKNSTIPGEWILEGLVWGFFMFLIIGLAMPYAEDGHLELEKTIRQFGLWLVGGLLYGFTMKLVRQYHKNKK